MTPQIRYHLNQMVEEMESIARRVARGGSADLEMRKRILADYRSRALREMSYSHSTWSVEKRGEVLDMWAQQEYEARPPTH